MTTYTSVPADVVARIRQDPRNHNGTPVARVLAAGGEPVRCCLAHARQGEPLILVSVDLGLPTSSPYSGTSPVYLHADPGCVAGESTAYPPAWVGRRQVVRAYDARGWIAEAVTHESRTPAEVIDGFLGREDVVQVLSFNVAHGCYMFTARR